MENFKKWQLGVDNTIANGQFMRPSLNQILAKKWDVKAALQSQKERKEEEKGQLIQYSKKIEKGILYREDKLKEQMKTIGGYTVKALKIPVIMDKTVVP